MCLLHRIAVAANELRLLPTGNLRPQLDDPTPLSQLPPGALHQLVPLLLALRGLDPRRLCCPLGLDSLFLGDQLRFDNALLNLSKKM